MTKLAISSLSIVSRNSLKSKDSRYSISSFFRFVSAFLSFLQVPPAELEDLLLSHPGVQDAAVIGVPDQQAGELPRAFVVRRDPKLTEEAVAEFVKSKYFKNPFHMRIVRRVLFSGKVSHYKQLKGGVEFLPEIPKSPSGKILRRFLRDRMQTKAKI